jgi:hypothetical protein
VNRKFSGSRDSESHRVESHDTRLTDHGAFHSIYFFDPNGHRIELACPDPDEQALLKRLDAVKWDMLEEWSRTRRAPRHAAFLHERELRK